LELGTLELTVEEVETAIEEDEAATDPESELE
jgi:hypothetical protein